MRLRGHGESQASLGDTESPCPKTETKTLGCLCALFLGQGRSALTSAWTLLMGLTQSQVRDTQHKGLHECESLVILKEHTGSENLHTATLRRSKLRNSRIQRPLWLGWATGSEGHTWSLE